MKQIFRIFTLIAVAMLTAGHAWAGTSFGKISYSYSSYDGGELKFYTNAECSTEISLSDNTSSALSVGTVYIKAMPALGHKLGDADNDGKVTFITAEVTAGTGAAGARTRSIAVGDFIDVTATTTKGVYQITMPADKKLNVTFSVRFPKNEMVSVDYIDPTRTGDERNRQAGALPLTGLETIITAGWYVVEAAEPINYNGTLNVSGNVNIILTNGATMNFGSEDNRLAVKGIVINGRATLTIYGQGGLLEEQGSLKVFTVPNSGFSSISSNSLSSFSIFGGNVSTTNGIGGQGALTIRGGSYTDTSTDYSVNVSTINIYDGKVTTTGSLYSSDSEGTGITISGGQVTTQKSISSQKDITLGWTNATDFIKAAMRYSCGESGTLSVPDKRFYVCTPANGNDPETVVAVIAGTAGTDGYTKDDIAGKILRPCDSYFVKLADGVTGVTVSATGGENVTIGTNTWYKVAKGAEVTLSATDSNKQLGSVEITGATATQGDGTFTFTIGESDVTVTAATFLEKVTYIDPTVEGDNKTKTVFATPLTGSESTLGAGWYVVNKDIDYTTVDNNSVVLTATGDVNFILADDKTMNIGSAATPVEGYGIRFNSSASLAIYGQGAKQNGSTEGSLNIYTGNVDPISLVNDITIYGGNVTVGDGLAPNGKFTIHGGTFNDPRTTYSSGSSAINAAEINICGGTVTSVNRLYGNGNGTGNVTISGGEVSVHSILTTKGSVTISGGQVTLADVISETDIILGWTNAATDFIKASGYYCGESGTLSIANDQALMSTGNDANVFSGTIDKENGIYPSYPINGKTLKPALMITLPTGVTATGTNVVTSETAGTYAISGTTVTLDGSNYTAPDGLTLNGFTVKDADGTTVTVSNGSFTMPAKAVTVSATFSYTDGTITLDQNGYSVKLEESGENTNPLPVTGDVTIVDYQRPVTPPTNDTYDTKIGDDFVNLFTVCLPDKPTTGTDVKYYTLSSVSGSTLKFTEVATTDLNSFTPYLGAAKASFTEQFENKSFNTATATINSKTVGDFTFTGTLTGLTNSQAIDKAGSDCIYILQHQAKWGKVVSGNASVKIPPFRAYITGPDVTLSGVRELNSSFEGEDDATGIQNILTVDRDGTERWYDLNGRRIDQPTKKGIYINNGKKVIKK